MVFDGITAITVNNTTMVGGEENDPFPGEYKSLRIIWFYPNDLKRRAAVVQEHHTLNLVTGKITSPEEPA